MRLSSAFLLTAAATSFACDNPFTYSYLTETLKPGQIAIEQWATARIGRDIGSGYDARYRGFDFKTEIEQGISENEQISYYVNYRYFDTATREGLQFDGIQIAYLRMLADPDKNSWGQAIYIEPGYSQASGKNGSLRDQYSLELKYLLQHNFGEKQDWVYAANLIAEIERTPSTDSDAVSFKITQGIAHEINANWYAGLEAVASAEWAELNNFEYATIAIGPCVRYQKENGFFTTVTAMAQIYGSPADKGNLNVSEKSPYEFRLKAGMTF
jgi:hypothetical protein